MPPHQGEVIAGERDTEERLARERHKDRAEDKGREDKDTTSSNTRPDPWFPTSGLTREEEMEKTALCTGLRERTSNSGFRLKRVYM